MESRNRHIFVYTEHDGTQPFVEWLNTLADMKGRATVRARIARLEVGNFGDSRAVGGGIQELRVHYGPGYRVYFALHGNSIVLLLGGGLKRTQKWDIESAKRRWADGKERL